MFGDAHAFNQPLDKWKTESIALTADMFRNARAFNRPVNHFDMSKVTHAQLMFSGATAFNQPLDTWDLRLLRIANNMFNGATAFNQNLGMWKLNALESAPNMFRNSGMDCTNYSNTLIGWDAYAGTPTRTLPFTGQLGRVYNSTAQAARQRLIARGWQITDDTYDATCGIIGKLWIGTNSTDWNTASNWRDNEIPAPGETVIFATATNYTHAAINDLHVAADRVVENLINESGKALVVLPENRITINNIAVVNGDERIVVKAGADTRAGGSLLFAKPANNTNVPATVELYTKSHKRTTGGGVYPYLWQYVGIPVQSLAPAALGTQTRVRAWDETLPELDSMLGETPLYILRSLAMIAGANLATVT